MGELGEFPASGAFGRSDPFGNYWPTTDFIQHTAHPAYAIQNDHSSHPNFLHLTGLVSEAVLEVVCVSSLGYIVARNGMFDGNAQKMVANLNIMIFTPCLIFSKLAKQLSGEKLLELAIIPAILLLQTLLSFCSAKIFTTILRIKKKPQQNFVTAMAVFGNSNSLPLSLVISLSQTIRGLHWDKIPGDNDNEVAARGILYLLVFSQIGQALRWSWGMNTLLRPLTEYTPEELGELPADDTERAAPYKDNADDEERPGSAGASSNKSIILSQPVVSGTTISNSSGSSSATLNQQDGLHQRTLTRNSEGEVALGDESSPQQYLQRSNTATSTREPSFLTNIYNAIVAALLAIYRPLRDVVTSSSSNAFKSLPTTMQSVLSKVWFAVSTFVLKVWSCINVPLASILISVLVASIPNLQKFFFTPDTFVSNTVTAAINQTGGVAVPLILVVLGANLAKNTLPDEGVETSEYKREKNKMLFASLICRMLLPMLIMAPILALMAKYLPISILDDPIFIIVCFLLAGAPSALQLAQMSQVNGVYVSVISKLLMHSYVFWIFPSTLLLVLLALEVVEWSKPAA